MKKSEKSVENHGENTLKNSSKVLQNDQNDSFLVQLYDYSLESELKSLKDGAKHALSQHHARCQDFNKLVNINEL